MVKPGYKQTEMGIIPENWEVLRWEECLSGFTSGATPYRGNPDYYTGNIKWVTSGELNHNTIYDTIEHITIEAKSQAHLAVHPAGTFLIAITGLEAVGTRGNCAILGVEATTNQSCMAIYSSEKADIMYVYYYYEQNGDDLAFKYCQGTKQQSYTAAIVKKLPILVPPINEQRHIAKALSEIDELIDSLEKLITKKKAIKQGIMEELLTGKRRLPGFTGNWMEFSIDDIAELSTVTVPIDQIDIQYYIGTDNMLSNKGGIRKNEIAIPYAVVREYRVGDILLSNIRPYLKKIWLADKNGGCSNDVFVIRTKDKDICISSFLYYSLCQDSFFDEVMANAIGTKMPRGDKSVLLGYSIHVPNEIEEQTAIVDVLRDFDINIERLRFKLKKARQIKQGMMQQLLTGRIRLL